MRRMRFDIVCVAIEAGAWEVSIGVRSRVFLLSSDELLS